VFFVRFFTGEVGTLGLTTSCKIRCVKD
jgi:hypothetical protein